MDRFQAEESRLPPERRDMFLNYFPKFLADLEMELGNDASPAWDPAYVQRLPVPSENIKSKHTFLNVELAANSLFLFKQLKKMESNRMRQPVFSEWLLAES